MAREPCYPCHGFEFPSGIHRTPLGRRKRISSIQVLRTYASQSGSGKFNNKLCNVTWLFCVEVESNIAIAIEKFRSHILSYKRSAQLQVAATDPSKTKTSLECGLTLTKWRLTQTITVPCSCSVVVLSNKTCRQMSHCKGAGIRLPVLSIAGRQKSGQQDNT